jgi:hypothetical protein
MNEHLAALNGAEITQQTAQASLVFNYGSAYLHYCYLLFHHIILQQWRILLHGM